MTIKKRLAITIVLMLAVPILIIALMTAVMIAGMTLNDRALFVDTLQDLGRESLSSAIHPGGKLYGAMMMWALFSVSVMVASVATGIVYISRKLLVPMRELTRAAERIRDGELDFEVMSATDAEMKELCETFDDARLRLKASVAERLDDERRRNLMLANISHDLRTPVTSIKGYVEGIRDGVAATPEMRERYLDTIYIKAAALERMIEQMSDYSELELGRMQFDLAPHGAAEFFASLYGEFSADFEAENASFILQIDSDLDGVSMLMDTEKLRRVYQNLLSNCMKYRDSARALGVCVNVSLAGAAVHAVISDNGRGIAEGDINRVFEGFYRGDPSRTGTAGGHGLGLAIARHIVQKHGGKIWLQSVAGVGTEAHVSLPVHGSKET